MKLSIKKLAPALIISCISLNVLAVPPGIYLDNRGNVKAHVDQSGKEISKIESDGSVLIRYSVIRENPDGSFSTHNNVGVDEHNNAWWEENGKIYLRLGREIKLGNRSSVLVREN